MSRTPKLTAIDYSRNRPMPATRQQALTCSRCRGYYLPDPDGRRAHVIVFGPPTRRTHRHPRRRHRRRRAHPMTRPAPAFDCAACGRRIGKTTSHVLLGERGDHSVDHLICVRCMNKGRHWGLHTRFYPDCPTDWHDLYDHPSCSGTRAGIASLLGLWPTTQTTPAGPTDRGDEKGTSTW
jgi:hypothetical protein